MALNLDITANAQDVLRELGKVQSGLGQLDDRMEKTRRRGQMVGDALGGLALGAGLAFAVGEFEEAEKAARSTEAVIESMGTTAGVSAEEQAKLVDELSRLAGVDDDIVTSGANMLRTFDQIQGHNFADTLAVSLDYAQMKGKDLQSTVEMFGRALQNPADGLTKLTKAGVSFTDEQKTLITSLDEAGRTAEAQAVMLAELERQYGGQAEAAATSSGRAKVAIGELAETTGKVAAPALESLADTLGGVADVVDGLPQPVQTAGIELGIAAIAAHKMGIGMKAVPWAAAAIGALEVSKAMAAAAEDTIELDKVLTGTTDEVLTELASLNEAADIFGDGIFADVGEQDIQILYRMRDALGENYDANSALGRGIEEAERRIKQAAETQKAYKGEVEAVTGAEEELVEVQGTALGLIGDRISKLSDLTDSTTDAFDATKALNDETQRGIDQAGGALDAQLSYDDAVRDTEESQLALADARKNGDAADIERAEADLTRSIQRQAEAAENLARKTAEAEGKQYDAGTAANVLRDEYQKARTMTGYWNEDLGLTVTRLDETARERQVKIDTATAEANLARLNDALIKTIDGWATLAKQPGMEIGGGVQDALDVAMGRKTLGPAPADAPAVRPGRSLGGLTLNVGTMQVGGGKRELDMAFNRAQRAMSRVVRVG